MGVVMKSLTTFLKRHTLVMGIVLMFLLTWPIELGRAAETRGLLPFHIPLVVSLTVGYGFVVASVVMTWLTLGKDGVIALLKRFVLWRVAFKWYLMAFLLLPAISCRSTSRNGIRRGFMITSIAKRSDQNAAVGKQVLARMLALYLVPGMLITLVFVIIAALTTQYQVPASLALLLTWLLAGVPLLLGMLLYQGWKRNDRISLAGIVLYREPQPLRQYLWLVPVLLIWAAISSTLLIPLAQALQRTFFAWWPDWLVLSSFAQNLNQYSQSVLWASVILSFVLNIAVPIVEELYFRGYLLPQIAHWGKWAPLINVMLFSLYHFWLPWEIPTRIITLLPIVYVVQWKRNIYLSILVHCLLNTIGSIGLLVLVLAQR